MTQMPNVAVPAVPVESASLRAVLLQAAAIAARLYRVGTKVTQKSDGSPLTEADTEVNGFLREALSELLPAAGWLSEETADDFDRLAHEWVWIVDPVDGTREFTEGIPEFAVSVGLVYRQRAVLGGVVNPASGEGGMGWVDGPVEFWGGVTPRPPAADLSQAFASISRAEIDNSAAKVLVDLIGATQPVGSVAYKLLRVAAGRDHLTFSVQPKSEWDICGGVALLAAAGKVYRRFDGKPLIFNGSDTRIRSGAVAGSEALVGQFLSELGHYNPRTTDLK